jgi:hypothetical protein
MTAGLAASKRVSKGLTFAALIYTKRSGDVCSINSFGLCWTLQYITALAPHKFIQKKQWSQAKHLRCLFTVDASVASSLKAALTVPANG